MLNIFNKYKKDIEINFKKWLDKNNYKEVDLSDKVIEDLMDEFLCLLSGYSDFGFIMDEIDKDGLLGEYEWCEDKS